MVQFWVETDDLRAAQSRLDRHGVRAEVGDGHPFVAVVADGEATVPVREAAALGVQWAGVHHVLPMHGQLCGQVDKREGKSFTGSLLLKSSEGLPF